MARKFAHPHDPRALIAEAYRIEGIGPEECRAIFFDWALGLPADSDPAEAAKALLDHHAGAAGDHPMTVLLRQAAEAPGPRGRGRRRRRTGDEEPR